MTQTAEQATHQVQVWFYAGRSEAFAAAYVGLHEQLTDEQADQLKDVVRLAEDAAADRQTAAVYDMIDGIACHFPAFGAAIRAVGRHVFDAGTRSACGVRVTGVAAVGEPDVHWVECAGFVPAGSDGAA